MILTTKARYAVMAVIEIAENKSNQPLTLATVAELQNLSLSYLEQIFSKLKKSNIVVASKGPGGGYVLAKSPKEITIASIVQAVDESIKMTRCISENKGCMKNNARCKSHQLWSGLEKNILNYLESVTIGDLFGDL